MQDNVIKKYSIIYMDPPWEYNKRPNNTKSGLGAMGHYGTMTMQEIKALPISDLAAENCAVFMWCTHPKLDQQIQLFRHWGFRFCTCAFMWIKTTKAGKPYFGVGHYTKHNSEPCYLGVKGKMTVKSNFVSQIIIQPQYRGEKGKIIHSKKPEIVREKIVELFGDLPRLEMFARDTTDGWDVWGNEVEDRIDIFEETQMKLIKAGQ